LLDVPALSEELNAVAGRLEAPGGEGRIGSWRRRRSSSTSTDEQAPAQITERLSAGVDVVVHNGPASRANRTGSPRCPGSAGAR